jgi:hypothetical protein
MEKKNLEQLYLDGLKGFQETPDERVWRNIEASLEKKKRKGIVPIWWQLGGVAALLAILFYVINPFANNVTIDGPTITDVEQKEDSKTEGEQSGFQEKINSSSSLPSTTELTESTSKTEKQEVDETPNPQQNFNSERINRSQQNSSQPQKNGQLAANTTPQKPINVSEEKDVLNTNIEQQGQEVITEVSENINDVLKNKKEDNFNTPNFDKQQSTDVAVTENENDSDEKSIFEVIEKKEVEKKAIAENTGGRWSVGPSVAPVYFNAIGEGSPVHSNFSANSKTGNVDISYGLNVAYEINKKLSIRTGLHRVNYGYDTNEIAFSSSLNASTNEEIENISYNAMARGLVVQSKATSTPNPTANADVIARTPQFDGQMVQQFGYMEIPLELNYALIDKRFGVNLIGGMSSLFLVENAVLLETDGLVTEMGEANNVNDVNFSTNIGLGLNYKFSEKIRANLEPVFKYQLNTFSNIAGDFRPFSVGVYSGLSFKF